MWMDDSQKNSSPPHETKGGRTTRRPRPLFVYLDLWGRAPRGLERISKRLRLRRREYALDNGGTGERLRKKMLTSPGIGGIAGEMATTTATKGQRRTTAQHAQIMDKKMSTSFLQGGPAKGSREGTRRWYGTQLVVRYLIGRVTGAYVEGRYFCKEKMEKARYVGN